MKQLPKTNAELVELLTYLNTRLEGTASRRLQRILYLHAVWSPEEDTRNAASARGFCHVAEGENAIFCAAAIESIIPCVRVGILTHEIAHILATGGMKGDSGEIAADKWILDNVPEAGYNYLSEYEYYSPLVGHNVTARNIQTVSPEFVRNLRG
jgi:hypothetical protein